MISSGSSIDNTVLFFTRLGSRDAKMLSLDICRHHLGFDFEFNFSSIGVQERNDASVATNLHFS